MEPKNKIKAIRRYLNYLYDASDALEDLALVKEHIKDCSEEEIKRILNEQEYIKRLIKRLFIQETKETK